MIAMKKVFSTRSLTMGWIAAALVIAVVLAGSVCRAAEPYVYPSKGQSKEKMEQDKYSCYQWAKGESGFDPMQVPTATSPPPEKKGGAVRGAAGGALAGVAIGAIAGDAGKGAAIGAASGGIIGGARKHKSEKEQEKWAADQSANYSQKRNNYDRAWSACMTGRGYTVQ